MNNLIQAAAPVASAVAIVTFALPSYFGVLRLKGLAKGLLVLLLLGLFTLGIEILAVKTGLPYGKFTYGSAIGYKVLGAAPWPVVFAYPPILLGAFWLGRKISGTFLSVVLTAVFVLAANLLIAPALSQMGIWQWEVPGPFFGTPLLAFAGRFAVALLSGALLTYLWGETEVRRSLSYSLFAVVMFWAGVNLGLQQWILGSVGTVAGLFLLIIMWREKKREENIKL